MSGKRAKALRRLAEVVAPGPSPLMVHKWTGQIVHLKGSRPKYQKLKGDKRLTPKTARDARVRIVAMLEQMRQPAPVESLPDGLRGQEAPNVPWGTT